MKALRTIYRYWITLLFAAVLAQISAAAYGGFYAAQKLGDQKGSDESKVISEKTFDHGFGFHTAFGYLIFLGASFCCCSPSLRGPAREAFSSRWPCPSRWRFRSCWHGSAGPCTASASSTGSTRSSSSG